MRKVELRMNKLEKYNFIKTDITIYSFYVKSNLIIKLVFI